MKSPRVLITIGIPGSGKSTWAKYYLSIAENTVRVSRDDYRLMLRNQPFLDRDGEELVSVLQRNAILTALDHGYDVVVDATNVNAKFLRQLLALVETRASVSFVQFDTPVEECIRRDAARPQPVGEAVIHRMEENRLDLYRAMDLHPIPRRIVTPGVASREQPDLPKAVIFDIDGTLARMGDRSPFDWAKVGEDTPNPPVVEQLRLLDEARYHILLCSGRDAVCRPQTEAWLQAYAIPYDALWMRPEGDTRKDSIIKEEIYRTHIEPHYHVQTVFDDRNQVVALWRSLGLTCFQVADGNF